MPLYASCVSDSKPTALATRKPEARSERWASNALFPMPASPRSTTARPRPASTSAKSRSSSWRSESRPTSRGSPMARLSVTRCPRKSRAGSRLYPSASAGSTNAELSSPPRVIGDILPPCAESAVSLRRSGDSVAAQGRATTRGSPGTTKQINVQDQAHCAALVGHRRQQTRQQQKREATRWHMPKGARGRAGGGSFLRLWSTGSWVSTGG
jgi:hypothetical protein